MPVRDYPTVKERAFVEFLVNEAKFNGTRAATLAKYKSPTTASTNLLKKDSVKKYLDVRLGELSQSRDRTLYNITRIAQGDISYFYDGNGGLTLESETAIQHSHLIQQSESERETTYDKDGNKHEISRVKIKLYSALDANTLFMRHYGLLSDAPAQSNVTNNTLVITDAKTIAQSLPDGLTLADVLPHFKQLIAEIEQQIVVDNPPPLMLDATVSEAVEIIAQDQPIIISE